MQPAIRKKNFEGLVVETVLGFFGHVVDHCFQILGLFKLAQLPIRASAILKDPVYVFDLVPAVQFVDRFADKLKVLANQFALVDFFLFAKINELPVDAITHSTPLVLHQQGARVLAKNPGSGREGDTG